MSDILSLRIGLNTVALAACPIGCFTSSFCSFKKGRVFAFKHYLKNIFQNRVQPFHDRKEGMETNHIKELGATRQKGSTPEVPGRRITPVLFITCTKMAPKANRVLLTTKLENKDTEPWPVCCGWSPGPCTEASRA